MMVPRRLSIVTGHSDSSDIGLSDSDSERTTRRPKVRFLPTLGFGSAL